MPGPEFPTFDDKRIRFGMPGLRYGMRLPSYITDPPNLTVKTKRRHTMQVPSDPDAKETLGFNAADGAAQYQASLPLKANLHDAILADAQANSDARRGYAAADAKCRVSTSKLRIGRDNAKSWLTIAKNLLTPTLGKKPCAAWTEAGWSDQSIAIPQSEDQVAYVLGEVRRPGVLRLRSEDTLLDAIAQVGGPTPEANLSDVFIIRRVRVQPSPKQGLGKSDKKVVADQVGHFSTEDDFPDKGVVQRVNLKELISHGDYRKNYILKAGDMVYVPETGLARWNYYISQISPTVQMVNVAASAGANLKYMKSALPAVLGIGN